MEGLPIVDGHYLNHEECLIHLEERFKEIRKPSLVFVNLGNGANLSKSIPESLFNSYYRIFKTIDFSGACFVIFDKIENKKNRRVQNVM